jgi:hypothetical protein
MVWTDAPSCLNHWISSQLDPSPPGGWYSHGHKSCFLGHKITGIAPKTLLYKYARSAALNRISGVRSLRLSPFPPYDPVPQPSLPSARTSRARGPPPPGPSFLPSFLRSFLPWRSRSMREFTGGEAGCLVGFEGSCRNGFYRDGNLGSNYSKWMNLLGDIPR